MSDAEKLENMRAEVTTALVRLERLFKHHKLTFIARNTKPGTDADVVISNDDDHPAVAAVLLEHEARARRAKAAT